MLLVRNVDISTKNIYIFSINVNISTKNVDI